jgi:hypothetical protein
MRCRRTSFVTLEPKENVDGGQDLSVVYLRPRRADLGLVARQPGCARAGEPPLTEHLNGLINDYSPASVGGGPYEIRGEWSLELNHGSVTADFSAAVNMETSDWGISKGTVDPSDPTTRGAHTHHITLSHATVSNDWSVCPAFNPPVTAGFVVTGTASVTGNGSPAPFEANGNPPSTLQVCVTGGSQVAFSNITLVFSGPATKHFGTQAIHGLVSCTAPGLYGRGICGLR